MKLSRTLPALAVALIASVTFAPHILSAQSAGVYSTEQAKAGAAIVQAQCSVCHGDKLQGISGPQLVGPDFIAKWTGQTAGDVRDIIATQMPLTNPGSLKPDQVNDVLSYILQQNKYPAGDSPLTAAKAQTVKIVKQG